MRLFILAVITAFVLSGCDAVHMDEAVSVKSDAVKVNTANTVAPGAITGELKPGAVQVGKGVEANVTVAKDAIHVEPITITPTTTVQDGALRFNIEQGAVHMPLTFTQSAPLMAVTIPEGAIKINVTLNVEKDAFVVRGAEVQAGAISTSPWLIGLLVVLALGWVITKIRSRKTRSRTVESSFWDYIF